MARQRVSPALSRSDRSAASWPRTPLRNLDGEATYIAQGNPAAARLVVQRVLDAVAQLADQPTLGRPGRVPGTRELVVPRTRYLMPYRVRGDTVEVPRAFHTSRRLPARWRVIGGQVSRAAAP